MFHRNRRSRPGQSIPNQVTLPSGDKQRQLLTKEKLQERQITLSTTQRSGRTIGCIDGPGDCICFYDSSIGDETGTDCVYSFDVCSDCWDASDSQNHHCSDLNNNQVRLWNVTSEDYTNNTNNYPHNLCQALGYASTVGNEYVESDGINHGYSTTWCGDDFDDNPSDQNKAWHGIEGNSGCGCWGCQPGSCDWVESMRCWNAGCTDQSACNYNPDASDDDGSCTYADIQCWDGSMACCEYGDDCYIECPANCQEGEVDLGWGHCENYCLSTWQPSDHCAGGCMPSGCLSIEGTGELDIWSYPLNGPISPNIGQLTNLYRIDLSSTDVNGEIPEEICNVTNLVEFNLHFNQLTGQIPRCLCNVYPPTPGGTADVINIAWETLYNNLCPEQPDCFYEYFNYLSVDYDGWLETQDISDCVSEDWCFICEQYNNDWNNTGDNPYACTHTGKQYGCNWRNDLGCYCTNTEGSCCPPGHCETDENCRPGTICRNGQCVYVQPTPDTPDIYDPPECTIDRDCAMDEICRGGVCGPRPPHPAESLPGSYTGTCWCECSDGMSAYPAVEIGDGCNSDSQCSTMCDSYCPTAYNSDWYNNWYSCSGLR